MNYRPEYRHGWGSKTYYQQMRVDALPVATAENLVQVLLGKDPSLAPLKGLLIERTEGNPLFLEESVRTLVETRILTGEPGAYRITRVPDSLEMPVTAQAIVAARIDRLEPDDKRLLQAAAVLGKDVPLVLLASITDIHEDELRQRLAQLHSAEFLYEARLFPEVEYTFKHALTHEVVYASLLVERRRELHGRIVEAVEELHSDRLAEHVERLAHHALRGELREKALKYLRLAGVKAQARSALPDARAWFEQALGMLDTMPENQTTLEQAFNIRLELRLVLAVLGESREMLKRVLQADTFAQKLNDESRRGRVAAYMTVAHQFAGQFDEAVVAGRRALAIAGRLGDLRLRILATGLLESTLYERGEYEHIVRLAKETLAIVPADWLSEDFELRISSSLHRNWLVRGLTELGRFTEAFHEQTEALGLAELAPYGYSVGMLLMAGVSLHLVKGDWAQARLLIDRLLTVTRMGNATQYLPRAVAVSAVTLARVGETAEAQTLFREGKRLVDEEVTRGTVCNRSRVYQLLGRTCLLLGGLDEARNLADRAVECSQFQPGHAAYGWQLLGDIATSSEQSEAKTGEAHYYRALEYAEPRGMRPLVAHCHLGLGKLYRRTDRREQAEEHLATATTMYREMGMTYWLEKAEAEVTNLGDRLASTPPAPVVDPSPSRRYRRQI